MKNCPICNEKLINDKFFTHCPSFSNSPRGFHYKFNLTADFYYVGIYCLKNYINGEHSLWKYNEKTHNYDELIILKFSIPYNKISTEEKFEKFLEQSILLQ